MNNTAYENLEREFIMHVLKRTRRSPALEVYQYQMQMFLDSLARYLDPADLELISNAPFTIFDDLHFIPNGQGDDEDVYVSLSPQGHAIFRAWLRRRGIDPA